jgi:hypothetical protein
MTTEIKPKNKGGRPPKVKPQEPVLTPEEQVPSDVEPKDNEEIVRGKTGSKFIVINTPTVKGVRVNLDKVITYGTSQETNVNVAFGDGIRAVFKFSTPEDAMKCVQRMDEYCLD